ncbi:MAG: Peptidoglycan-binding domain 1 protein [Solirubrobacterales bacterium]|nr:Peptidoglycan-binding domain 1 protein [Solirubrobacterales bacterium]
MPLSPTFARRLRVATALAVVTVPAQAAGAATSPTATSAGFQRALGLPASGSGSLASPPPRPTPTQLRRAERERLASARTARVQRRLRQMKQAGQRIARHPYVYGGGHGSFTASGYDCSGSVSYVLHAAGLLKAPLASGALATYGRPGRGKHVTIYANGGHAFMVVDGRRFDTIALKQTGTRWSATIGSTQGYVARHPQGL